MTEDDAKLYRATLKAWTKLKEQGGGREDTHGTAALPMRQQL